MQTRKRRDGFPVFYAEAKDFKRQAAIQNRATHKDRAPRAGGFLAHARRDWDAHVMATLTADEKALLPVVLRVGETLGYGKWTHVALGLVTKGLLTQTPEGKFKLSPGGAKVARRLVS